MKEWMNMCACREIENVCIYIYIYIYVCIYIYIYVYVCMYACVCVCIYIRSINTHTHTWLYKLAFLLKLMIYTNTHTHIHKHTHTHLIIQASLLVEVNDVESIGGAFSHIRNHKIEPLYMVWIRPQSKVVLAQSYLYCFAQIAGLESWLEWERVYAPTHGWYAGRDGSWSMLRLFVCTCVCVSVWNKSVSMHQCMDDTMAPIVPERALDTCVCVCVV